MLNFDSYKRIVILTGAGISVASGLRTFRGPNGMWEEEDVARLSHADALRDDPDKAWQFYSLLRKAMSSAEPNAAHFSLANFEATRLPEQRFSLITQNIDGLHQKAGSQKVVEMHGAIYRTRCSNDDCQQPIFEDDGLHDSAPACSLCGHILRPDIVLFGEMLPMGADLGIRNALRSCDLFIAIGTSGTVFPACEFVSAAKYAGAFTILVNPEAVPMQNAFDEHISAAAEEALPQLFSKTM